MISIEDLSDAQMDILTKSCSLTIVITANGQVQTHEEATVYVKELNIFLTMKVFKNTPAVLSLGKLCDENGYSYEWINGQKPHLIKNGIRIPCNTENFVPIVVPGLSTSSSSSFPSSTSMTPSTSPTMTVSSDSETGALEDLSGIDSRPVLVSSSHVELTQRGDPCGIDSYPAAVSSKHVERQEWGDLCSSGTPEEQLLTKANKNPKPNKNEDPDLVLVSFRHTGMAARIQRKSRG